MKIPGFTSCIVVLSILSSVSLSAQEGFVFSAYIGQAINVEIPVELVYGTQSFSTIVDGVSYPYTYGQVSHIFQFELGEEVVITFLNCYGEEIVESAPVTTPDPIFPDFHECDLVVEYCDWILGCTNPGANNYDPMANYDDESCEFGCAGNTYELLLYSPIVEATITWSLSDYDGNQLYAATTSVMLASEIPICLEPGCYVFESNVEEIGGDCEMDITIWDNSLPAGEQVVWQNPYCAQSSTFALDIVDCSGAIYGCMDIEAANYNPFADSDDGTCIYLPVIGCSDSQAMNFSPAAEEGADNCVYSTNECPIYFMEIENPVEIGNVFGLVAMDADEITTSITWDFGDGQQTFGSEFSHQYAEPGIYELCVTRVEENCASTFCESIYISEENLELTMTRITGTTTGLFDGFSLQSAVNVYPNPTSSRVQFSLKSQGEIIKVIFVDISGREVAVEFESSLLFNPNLKSVWVENLEPLRPGLYQVIVQTDAQEMFGMKLSIER